MRRLFLVLALIAFQASGCRVAHAAPDEAQLKAAAKAEIAAMAAIMTDLHLGKGALIETLELMALVKLRCAALTDDGRAALEKAQSDSVLIFDEKQMLNLYVESAKICEDANRAAAAFTSGLKP